MFEHQTPREKVLGSFDKKKVGISQILSQDKKFQKKSMASRNKLTVLNDGPF